MNSSQQTNNGASSHSKGFLPFYLYVGLVLITWVIGFLIYYKDYLFLMENPEYSAEYPEYIAFSNFYYIYVLVWPLVCLTSLLFCLKLFGVKSQNGSVWLVLMIAIVLWLCADAYYPTQWFLNDHTEPEEAALFSRIFYMIGYVIIVLGLLLQLRIAQNKLERSETILLIIIEVIFLYFSLTIVVIPIIQYTTGEELTALDQFALIYYLVIDLISVSFGMLVIFKFRGGQFARSWLLITIGIIFLAIYDLVYTYFTYIQPLESVWYFFESVYYLMYILISCGALHLYFSVKNANI
jgi:hypothetical protein